MSIPRRNPHPLHTLVQGSSVRNQSCSGIRGRLKSKTSSSFSLSIIHMRCYVILRAITAGRASSPWKLQIYNLKVIHTMFRGKQDLCLNYGNCGTSFIGILIRVPAQFILRWHCNRWESPVLDLAACNLYLARCHSKPYQ